MLELLHKTGQAGLNTLRRLLDVGFEQSINPMRHLGALTIFFLWIVLVSGIWVFAFFHTSVSGAYESVEYMTHEQWYLGGVMRSLHRYASDAAVITIFLHIVKEFSFDRYRGNWWFSWVTGTPLLWLVFPLGITGYWLVWDSLAQYVAVTSAELLDAVPIFTDSMARNFLSDASLSDRFFTLMTFLHVIALPLFLVFGIWFHVFRINGPRINPPRSLMAGSLMAMVVLSLVFPALSQGPANLAQVPQTLGLDWYYLPVYPLLKIWSPGWVWVLLVGISLVICIAPWLPPARSRPVAMVDLDNCNGCERCVDDCPFDAVSMAPRSDGKSYEAEALVDPALCVSCGICVGACPTATPFRKASALVPGIDLPDLSAANLRASIHATAENLSGNRRVLVFACHNNKATEGIKDEAVVEVRCMAQVPPAFIDYVLSRDLADGVLMTGCPGGDCRYRLGARWTSQRVARERDPQLRRRVDASRIALGWEQPWASRSDLPDMLGAFRATLAEPEGKPDDEPDDHPDGEFSKDTGFRWRRYAKGLAMGVTFGMFALASWRLSSWPSFQLLEPDQAMVSLTFSRAGQRMQECRTLTQQELEELPPNMRKPQDCPRERHPVQVEFSVDGEVLYQATRPPSGIWNDGESTIYQRILVKAGRHNLSVGMRDSDRSEGFDFQHESTVTLEPSQHLLVEFDHDTGTFIFE